VVIVFGWGSEYRESNPGRNLKAIFDPGLPKNPKNIPSQI